MPPKLTLMPGKSSDKIRCLHPPWGNLKNLLVSQPTPKGLTAWETLSKTLSGKLMSLA